MLGSVLVALVAASGLVSAFPGADNQRKTTCSTYCITTTTCGTKETVETYTKTVWVPVTKTKEWPETITKAYPKTEVDYKTKDITETKWKTVKKVKPVTSWKTYYDKEPYVTTICETIPYTKVITLYKTYVTESPKVYVTKTESKEICSTTEWKPYTSTIVKTETKCTTLGGYGR